MTESGENTRVLIEARVIPGQLPEPYDRVIEELSSEEVEALISIKARLDKANEATAAATPASSAWSSHSDERYAATATPSARLRYKIELVGPSLALPARRLLEDPRARELYPPYLATGYHVTCAMIELMTAALERARVLAPTDEVASELADYLERHLVEEAHHEKPGGAILDDLEAAGADAAALVEAAASDKIASLLCAAARLDSREASGRRARLSRARGLLRRAAGRRAADRTQRPSARGVRPTAHARQSGRHARSAAPPDARLAAADARAGATGRAQRADDVSVSSPRRCSRRSTGVAVQPPDGFVPPVGVLRRRVRKRNATLVTIPSSQPSTALATMIQTSDACPDPTTQLSFTWRVRPLSPPKPGP